MSVQELLAPYTGAAWAEKAIRGLVEDCPELRRSQAPAAIVRADPIRQVEWLTSQCNPPFALREIDKFLTHIKVTSR